MKLEDYLLEIINSNEEDWSVISCWGAGSGPSYLDQFTVWNTGNNEFHNLEVESHSMVASYKKNLSISIAWGLRHNDNFIEPWANKFPDSKAMSSYLDFFYNGVLISREIIVSVDGGRCYLPLPKREIDDKNYKTRRLYISKEKSDFVRMLNSFSNTRDYDRYINESGIEITDESWD